MPQDRYYMSLLFAYLCEHTITGNVDLAIRQFKEFFEIVEKDSRKLADNMKELLIEYRKKYDESSNLIDKTKNMK